MRSITGTEGHGGGTAGVLGRRRRRSRRVGVVAATFAAVALIAGCGTDEAAEPPSTTTGVVDRSTTTARPPSTSGDDADDLPGLWLAGPAGITDEQGTSWAEPKTGESLRSPLDDGLGGVLYLRCLGDAPTCDVEHATSKDTVAAVIGEADSLLAVGTIDDRRVIISTWTDPTIVPSMEEDRSGLVARLIDLDDGTVTALAGWFGWESGPFAADVEEGRYVVCFGEGESCSMTTSTGIDAPAPLAGTDVATVMSVAVEADGTKVTWVEAEPMSGVVNAHTAELPSGVPTTIQLRSEDAPTADDMVTDGEWVAIRTGTDVVFRDLAADPTVDVGTLTVVDGVSEMALRTAGGSAGSSVL